MAGEGERENPLERRRRDFQKRDVIPAQAGIQFRASGAGVKKTGFPPARE
jgi:hypothetical protein